MDYSILITLLRKKQYLTDLEKDILDKIGRAHV